MVSVLRPGQRILNIPAIGVQTSRRAVSVAAAWWLAGGAPTPIAVYQPKGAASLAASYVNLVNPGTYNAAPGVAPTWSAETGWTGGSGAYLVSVIPQIGYTTLVRFSNAGSLETVFGLTWNLRHEIKPNRVGFVYYYAASFSVLSVAPALTSGVLGVAGYSSYRNGIFDGTIPSGSGTETKPLFLLARNTGTAAADFFTGSVQAFVSYSTILTAPQVAAVSAAMAAL